MLPMKRIPKAINDKKFSTCAENGMLSKQASQWNAQKNDKLMWGMFK